MTLKEFRRQIDLAFLAGRGKHLDIHAGGGLRFWLPSTMAYWRQARAYSVKVADKEVKCL